MRTWLAALAALLVCPAVASAATATVEDGRLHYVAAPGEVNDLAVTPSGGEITVSDPGAEIAAQEGCTADDAHRVTCTAASLWAELGDGDDSVRSPSSHDTLDGGAGIDTISYGGRPDGIFADLESAEPDGHLVGGIVSSDEDTTTGFENVAGGAASDFLWGTGGDNVIEGGDSEADDGHDDFRGRKGNDTLIAGDLDASFSGGGGDDVLIGNAGRDTFQCGSGADVVETVVPIDDFIYDSCERLRNRHFVVEPNARSVGTRALRYVLECAGGCEGSIVVRRQRRNRPEHRLLGRARFQGEGRVTVRVPLTKIGRTFRRGNRRPITDTFVYGFGFPYTAWSTQLPATS